MAILKLAAFVLLIATGSELLGCTKKLPGHTSYREASKAFEKRLPGAERKAAIKQLQTETAR